MVVHDKNTNIADKLVNQIEQLPPMPANIIRLRRAAADPNMNYTDIAPILKEDPSMCADLLRIANSARYGVGHKVDTVEEAIRYFGMSSLVEFVAAACSEKIVREAFLSVKNLNDYLTHSRQISFASSFICRALNVSVHDQEVFSVTGLLHDIGRLVILLVTEEREFSNELLGVSWEDVSRYVADEREIYGLNHAELGMKICSKWQFPPRIVEGVFRHHNPIDGDKISHDGLVIFLSEIISIEGLPDNVLLKALPGETMKQAGIAGDSLLKARDDLMESVAP